MTNLFETDASNVNHTDPGKPPQRPSTGMFLLAIIGALTLVYAATGTSPDFKAELMFISFLAIGLFVVVRWAFQQARYMVRRNGGVHFGGSR